MKKVLFLFMCVIILLSGCGKNSENPKQQENAALDTFETTTIDNQEYYLIKSENDLKSIGITYPFSGNYALGNDIILTEEWKPIGNEEQPFTGIFDGNGYIIYDLTVTKKVDNIGFFGASEGAVLKNIILENANIDVLSFFPISYNSVDTEIINCSINNNLQVESSNDNTNLSFSLDFDNEEQIIDDLLKNDYQTMTVPEFNNLLLVTFKNTDNLLTAIEDLLYYYSPDSKEYKFVKYTLSASYSEIENTTKAGTFEGLLINERTAGRILMDTIEFSCHATYKCNYEIINDDVTVAMRDSILQNFDDEMQIYFEQQSEDFLREKNAKQKISEKIKEVAENLSNKDIWLNAQLNQFMLLDQNGDYQIIP